MLLFTANKLEGSKMKDSEVNQLKDHIIKTASGLFIKYGYGKTTIRQIAESSGLGRGHLYYYFKKKEDILLYLYKELLEKIYGTIAEKKIKENDIIANYIISQYIYTHAIATSEKVFRLYIEASNVRSIRKEYINILLGLFKEKLVESDYNFNDKDLYMSIAMGCAGECELLNQYYEGILNVDLDDIILNVVKTRFALLNVNEHIDIDKIIQEAKEFKDDMNLEEVVNNVVELSDLI